MTLKKKKDPYQTTTNPYQAKQETLDSKKTTQPPKTTGGFGPSNPAPSFINPSDWNETIRKAQNDVDLLIPTGEKNRVYENYQNMMNLKAPEQNPYKSNYQNDIDSVLDGILNANFEYDINTDPLYDQYKRMYNREGDRAYENALGEASALTGGRTNTFAMGAAQQAQNYYSTQLNDKVPELYQAAYSKYLQGLENDRANIGIMSGLDQADYQKYINQLNYDRGVYESDRNYYNQNYLDDRNWNYQAYIDDRNFNYGKEQDEIAQNQWQQSFDTANNQWQQSFDTANNQWQQSFDRNIYENDRNFNYGVERDQVADNQWQQSFDTSNNQWQQSFDRNNYESDRSYGLSASNAALNREQWEYQKEQDKLAQELAASNPGTEVTDDLGAFYQGMMSASDPAAWLIENSPYLSTEELETLKRMLPEEIDPLDEWIRQQMYQSMLNAK